jgi:PAS domain S-box-containing protein
VWEPIAVKARLPGNEEARLEALRQYEILDTGAEREYDDIVALASEICGVSVAVISLVDHDRQWFKSAVGIDAKETPRDIAFCAHAILGLETLVVEDARQDPRFNDNPLVIGEPAIRFYAGAPLITPEGFGLGTLCVIAPTPRKLTEGQRRALETLSRHVVRNIEFRRKNLELAKSRAESEKLGAAARESNRFLTAVLENLPTAVYCKDASNDFRYTICNAASEAMWGFADGYRLGKTDFEVFSSAQATLFRKIDEAAIRASTVEHSPELAVETPRGVRTIRSKRISLAGDNGEPKFVLGIAEDITEMKNIQIQMVQTAKMSTLGEMASGIAHEINNPLAIIRGHAEILKSALDAGKIDPERIALASRKIDQTCVRIARIIGSLKAFARDGESEPTSPVLASRIQADAIELCQARLRSHGVKFHFEPIPDSIVLECRSVQLTQVLLNLLNNAFDACLTANVKWVSIGVADLGDTVEFSVSDGGSPIPPEIQERMMLPFFTTKEVGKGTGLGLSISKSIVEGHRGVLLLDSSSLDTRFVFRIPKRANGSRLPRVA